MVLEFAGSAAPLESVGKEVKSGLTVTPPLAGKWQWEGDSKLQFNPQEDWKVGEHYTVKFERALLAYANRTAEAARDAD